jgi:hypothetical protein
MWLSVRVEREQIFINFRCQFTPIRGTDEG